MIYKLSTGDQVHRYQKSIVVQFEEERKVLSTSPINGGYSEKLKTVFNHDGNPGAGMAFTLKAPTYKEHMCIIAEELGLDLERTAGILTAASMENVSIKKESFEDVTVTAIVTCTEAKTAALQELMAGSNYSRGIATGSGTDGTIIICNSKSEIKLTEAGKHSKLGELIGLSVKAAVKEALFLQTGLCAKSQHSILKRTKRFGVTEDKIWAEYQKKVTEDLQEENSKKITKAEFIHNLHTVDTREDLVTLTSLYTHLLDQLDWKLLSENQVIEECELILNRIKEKFDIYENIKEEHNLMDTEGKGINGLIEGMIEKFITVVAYISANVKNL